MAFRQFFRYTWNVQSGFTKSSSILAKNHTLFLIWTFLGTFFFQFFPLYPEVTLVYWNYRFFLGTNRFSTVECLIAFRHNEIHQRILQNWKMRRFSKFVEKTFCFFNTVRLFIGKNFCIVEVSPFTFMNVAGLQKTFCKLEGLLLGFKDLELFHIILKKNVSIFLMFRLTENGAFESYRYLSGYFWYCNLDRSFLNSVSLKLHFGHFEIFPKKQFSNKWIYIVCRGKKLFRSFMRLQWVFSALRKW